MAPVAPLFHPLPSYADAAGSSLHQRGVMGEYDPAVGEPWDSSSPSAVRLPSGRLVRGRALSRPVPNGLRPALGIYLLDRRPPAVPWESRWLRWPDFGLPADPAAVLPTLTEAWQRAATERVEIACAGGHGRTGTALACLAILDGVPAATAVAFVRVVFGLRTCLTTSAHHLVDSLRTCWTVPRVSGRGPWLASG